MQKNIQNKNCNANDWIAFAKKVESAHCDARPANMPIELVVIHNISLPPDCFSGDYIEQFFCGTLNLNAHPYFATLANIQVSAHFLIRRNGELIQFVPLYKRAWHAGLSSWQDRERCNDFSVGIEMEGTDSIKFTQKQYQKLRRLLRQLKQQLDINTITGHSDIAPLRKTDPGKVFNWLELKPLGLHRFQNINA